MAGRYKNPAAQRSTLLPGSAAQYFPFDAFSQVTLNLELRRKNIYDQLYHFPFTDSYGFRILEAGETDWRPPNL
jgi:hypothetical protein